MEKDRIRVTAYLANVPLFSELEADEIKSLARGTMLVRLARNEILFRRGEPCLGFHIVVSGGIKLSLVSAHGEERVAQLVGAGDTFGEALMFAEAPYNVTAEALSDTLVLYVTRAAILPTIERDRAFARKMLSALSALSMLNARAHIADGH
jgi:CRP-like cAMP-binding protein